jgi:acetylornithine deacetylase/succinyl-diaminopimelate desuccinylase-like protein
MHRDELPEGLRPRLLTRARVGFVLALIATFGAVAAWAYGAMVHMPGSSFAGHLPELTPAERALAEELEADVRALSALGERSLHRPSALAGAAARVAARFEAAGHSVTRERYAVRGVPCENLVVRIPGDTDEVVVVGAHYDSAHGSPGANDNGTGVAALLALARRIPPGHAPARTHELVAFTNEEMPHFADGTMGSDVHAGRLAARGARVAAMLSLETLGYYDVREGSQAYPFPLSLVYPSRGDFIAFVGDRGSAPLVRTVVGAFRRHARFPSEGAALPADMPGVGWSDHRSYWAHGWPALMVTDTAPFRDPSYHLPSDTPERLDYTRLARVVEGLTHVVLELAESR